MGTPSSLRGSLIATNISENGSGIILAKFQLSMALHQHFTILQFIKSSFLKRTVGTLPSVATHSYEAIKYSKCKQCRDAACNSLINEISINPSSVAIAEDRFACVGCQQARFVTCRTRWKWEIHTRRDSNLHLCFIQVISTNALLMKHIHYLYKEQQEKFISQAKVKSSESAIKTGKQNIQRFVYRKCFIVRC